MGNMFAQAWRIPAKTSTPVPQESNQIMGKPAPIIISTPYHTEDLLPQLTQEPTPVIETPVGPDIDVAT